MKAKAVLKYGEDGLNKGSIIILSEGEAYKGADLIIARMSDGSLDRSQKEKYAAEIVHRYNMHAELVEALITMTALCLIKYGNLDKDVYGQIVKAKSLIKQAEQK
jgi:hypothetical protein